MNNEKLNKIKSILTFAYKLWKPDFLKTTGWFLITSGVLLISPSFLQYIVLSFLRIATDGFSPDPSDKIMGIWLIALGIQTTLLYEARNLKRKLDARIFTWMLYFTTIAFLILGVRYA